MFCIGECIADDVVDCREITLLFRADFNILNTYTYVTNLLKGVKAIFLTYFNLSINSLKALANGSGASIAVK